MDVYAQHIAHVTAHAVPMPEATLSKLEGEAQRPQGSNVTPPVVHCKLRISYAPEVSDRDVAVYEIRIALPPSTHGTVSYASIGASIVAAPAGMPEAQSTQWNVFRRYNDFAALHHTLSSTFPHIPYDDIFPPKHILSSSTSDRVVRERLDRLPAWLIAISQHDDIVRHVAFREFLEVHQHEEALRAAARDAGADAADVLASPVLFRLDGGFHQPGAHAVHVEASIPADHATMQERVHTAHTLAPAPPGDEIASAQVTTEVHMPHVDMAPAKAALGHAAQAARDTIHTEERARSFAVAAQDADARAAQDALELQRARDAAELLAREKREKDQAQQSLAADAQALEEEARRRREEAHRLASEKRATEARLKTAEREARAYRALVVHNSRAMSDGDAGSRMDAYEAAAKRAAELSALALSTHEEALKKKNYAVEEHMRATEEVLKTETALKAAADHEEHRHVSEAAAAAARTRANLTQASLLKAAETEALARATHAAEEEALALAQLQLCEERVRNARAVKEQAERQASLAQEECRAFTQAAATSAAELDAHSNAASKVRVQATKAETLLQAATQEHALAQQMVQEEHASSVSAAGGVHEEGGVMSTTLREFVDGRTIMAHAERIESHEATARRAHV